MPNVDKLWGTDDELLFIDTLGTSSQLGKKELTKPQLLQLLLGYQKGLSRRRVWTGLDSGVIGARIQRRIDDLRKEL